ncbi:hypothetical protein [Lignipirellula cremea]|uniref:Uncharacterized protein n=1 Tax=Lignipirellula cremea TaxID=2528010 RepID=A0A518DNM2_9BACT|nr:hypothetical protein [Lignipirellula cremea]QDU93438.1 hypothetical protein Pla8534_12180 [Lignipirellula cremea]
MKTLKQKMEESGLFQLSKSDAAAFCMACAERVRPVVKQLASPPTKAIYDKALEAGWSNLAHSGESHRIEKLMTALRTSDVTGEPTRRTFYVKEPLAALHHGLRAILFETPAKEAGAAWALSVGLARYCDYHLRKCDAPSPDYPLDELTCEDLENDGIEESLRILAACAGDPQKVREQLRPASQARCLTLQAALSRIDRAGGFGSK